MKSRLIGAFLLISLCSVAQTSLIYKDYESHFSRGIELFDEKNYVAAREVFEKMYSTNTLEDYLKFKRTNAGARSDNNSGLLTLQQLEYYVAVCAVKAGDKDAEKLMVAFAEKYSESPQRRRLAFYLGNYYYNQNKYGEALEAFLKVDKEDLSSEEMADYQFQLAYCYFVKKKFDEARPLFKIAKDRENKYKYPAGYYYAYLSFVQKDYDQALSAFEKIKDSKMYASVIPYYMAQIYFIKNNDAKVLETVEKNIGKSEVKYKPEMNFLRGQVLFKQRKYNEALPFLADYINSQSKVRPEDLFMLAYCQYKEEKYQEAVANFEQVNLVQDSLAQHATFALADCYLKLNQKEKARVAFLTASNSTLDKSITESSLFNYAKLSLELNQIAESVKAFEKYLNDYKNGLYVEETSELLTSALLQTRDFEKAYKIIEGIKVQTPLLKDAYQKVTYYRAVQLFNDKKLEQALTLINKSLEQPVSRDLQALANYLKAEILFEKGEFDGALPLYQKFNQLTTSEIERKNQVSKFRSLYNMGFCKFKTKEYSEAARYFEQAADESATTVDRSGVTQIQPDLILHLADCQFVSKSYSPALRNYDEVVRNKWSGQDYALYQKGMILGLQGKNSEKIEMLTKLTSSLPFSKFVPEAFFEIAETHFEESQFNNALLFYKKVVSDFPKSTLVPEAMMKTGLVNYNAGSKQTAINDYKKVIEKYPGSPQAREALNIIKEISIEMGKADEYFEYAEKIPGAKLGEGQKDSLSFAALDKAFEDGGCDKATPLMENYTVKFSSGIFIGQVRWALADCFLKSKNFAKAMPQLEDIIQNKRTAYYEQALLKASGISYFENKDYQKAFNYYKQLMEVASSTQNSYTAQMGACRSAFRLNNWQEAQLLSTAILSGSVAKASEVQEIQFVKGKSHFMLGEKTDALATFNNMSLQPVSERLAEAKFRSAEILYDNASYRASMDTCFVIKERYSSYEYWIVKTYILIGKNHAQLGNGFQAQATLESIINGYKGDAALVEEAKKELDWIKEKELQKSKLQIIEPGSEMEMDTTGVK